MSKPIKHEFLVYNPLKEGDTINFIAMPFLSFQKLMETFDFTWHDIATMQIGTMGLSTNTSEEEDG